MADALDLGGGRGDGTHAAIVGLVRALPELALDALVELVRAAFGAACRAVRGALAAAGKVAELGEVFDPEAIRG